MTSVWVYIIFLLILNMTIAFYLYNDAEKRGSNKYLWLILGLIFSILILTIWLIIRTSKQRICPRCNDNPLVWKSKQQQWFCYNCQSYINLDDPSNGEWFRKMFGYPFFISICSFLGLSIAYTWIYKFYFPHIILITGFLFVASSLIFYFILHFKNELPEKNYLHIISVVYIVSMIIIPVTFNQMSRLEKQRLDSFKIDVNPENNWERNGYIVDDGSTKYKITIITYDYSEHPLEDIKVQLEGLGINKKNTTNLDGKVTFTFDTTKGDVGLKKEQNTGKIELFIVNSRPIQDDYILKNSISVVKK